MKKARKALTLTMALATLVMAARESNAGPYGQTVYRFQYQVTVNWYQPVTGQQTTTHWTLFRDYHLVGSSWSETNNLAEIRQLFLMMRRNGWRKVGHNWRQVWQGYVW